MECDLVAWSGAVQQVRQHDKARSPPSKIISNEAKTPDHLQAATLAPPTLTPPSNAGSLVPRTQP